MVTCLAYCLDKELWKAIEYLKEQVRVVKEQQEKDQRILLNNHQRIRLATKAKQLTRELLEQATVLFMPETVLGWYRRLIAQKYDGSKNCKNPGRPKISQETVDLVIRFKEENPRWGYTRIRDYLVPGTTERSLDGTDRPQCQRRGRLPGWQEVPDPRPRFVVHREIRQHFASRRRGRGETTPTRSDSFDP